MFLYTLLLYLIFICHFPRCFHWIFLICLLRLPSYFFFSLSSIIKKAHISIFVIQLNNYLMFFLVEWKICLKLKYSIHFNCGISPPTICRPPSLSRVTVALFTRLCIRTPSAVILKYVFFFKSLKYSQVQISQLHMT